MCDTIVALGNATKDGSVLFGKNTDREPNEAHNLEYHPRKKYSSGSRVKCTYISIPQVEGTYEILLMKPFWMFGCEMGANEFGVTIGNEAVWSKEPYRETGLLGMDLMRLSLERSTTAKNALEIIISLLEKYDQGGAGGYTDKKLFYHNSFIIADPEEAWVLETADKFWIAEKVKDVRSISNTLTIGKKYDLIHPELIQHAINKGYCNYKEDFDFAKNFIPAFNILQWGAKGKIRQAFTTNELVKNKGKITPELMITILRNHNIDPAKEENWSPIKGSMKSPCLHYKSFITPNQSTGSHVAHLLKDFQIHWVTGTSAPCTSIYKPIFLPNAGLPEIGKLGGPQYESENIWWQYEKLHRLVLLDYQNRLSSFREERDELEKKFMWNVNEFLKNLSTPLEKSNIEKMKEITKEAFELSREKTDKWIKKIQTLPIQSKPGFLYRKRWKKLNKHDNLKI